MDPLFPRLHVNDKEKGGPRAPPRNKMALYEQLSIPSQRFNSRSASTLPLPPSNTSTLVPSMSSSLGGGRERSVLSSFYVDPPTPAHSAEKLHSRSSDGVNLNATTVDFERKSKENANYRTSNAIGHLSSTADCSLLRQRDFSNSRNSYGKKVGDEDDFMVPTFVHSKNAPFSSKDQQGIDSEKLTPFIPTQPGRSTVSARNSPLKSAVANFSYSMQPQGARDKLLKRTSSTDLKSRHIRNQSEENQNESVRCRDCIVKPASHRLTREKVAETLKHTNASSNQEHQNSLVDDLGRLSDTDAVLDQEHRAGFLPVNSVHGDGVSVQPMEGVEKGNSSRVISVPCSRPSLGSSHISPRVAETGSQYREDLARDSFQVGDVDRNDDDSETSMVDSLSGLDISPDDVVGIIGQKHFWKARRAISNQQRVFAVQVFELHRLIKVQRLFAGSPHLLLEEDPNLSKPSLKVSPVKKLPSEYVLKLPPRIVKQKDESHKPNQSIECAAENAVEKPPLPSLNNDISKGHVSQNSNCGPYSGNPPLAPVATDSKVRPWYFHPPPGNQWLVPVMTPSEGLVYKPYTGPCPPTSGFMPPIYGGCGPLSLPPAAGDFLHPIYGVAPSHQQGIGVLPGPPPVGQTYFSPYGMPVMNPVMSASAVEQMSLSAGARAHSQSEQLSTGEVNFNMHSRNLNMSNQKSKAISGSIQKFQTSKEGDVQGSTASSPCERSQGAVAGHVAEGRDVLPLFPMAPAMQVSKPTVSTHSGDQQTRVIKVVPHNPRSATKSAARIFRSIQEERQQYDSG